MGVVTGLTAARMMIIEAMSVVNGSVQGDNLVLTRRDGQTLVAGNVRGPKGDQGIPGNINVSPAGGALAGNYPNPDLATGAVNAGNIVDALKDGPATSATMRTLGIGAQQAAAGNHIHRGTWINVTGGAGEAPFASAATTRLQYSKVGSHVHVRITKTMTAARDSSTNVSGDFANVNVTAVGAIPTVARPDTQYVNGQANINNTPVAAILTPTGTIIWIGGFPRNYPSGAIFTADFSFHTDN